MIFDRRERQVRATLRKLSRQRVAAVLQPHGVWVIEKAIPDTEDSAAALKTCFMRGWVEPLEHAVPAGDLSDDGSLPSGRMFTRTTTLYRLTDSGWAVINRTHMLQLMGIFLAAVAAIIGLN